MIFLTTLVYDTEESLTGVYDIGESEVFYGDCIGGSKYLGITVMYMNYEV